MRVSVNLDKDLLSKIDKRAKEYHISRSSYIAVCVSRQISILEEFDEIAKKLSSYKNNKKELPIR